MIDIILNGANGRIGKVTTDNDRASIQYASRCRN